MPFPCPEGHVEPLHPWVEQLVVWLTELGRLKSLDDAVKAAVHEGISELTDWKISNGDDFLQYTSCLLKYWIPSENNTATFIYEVLTVFYCEFSSKSLPTRSKHSITMPKLPHCDYCRETNALPHSLSYLLAIMPS